MVIKVAELIAIARAKNTIASPSASGKQNNALSSQGFLLCENK